MGQNVDYNWESGSFVRKIYFQVPISGGKVYTSTTPLNLNSSSDRYEAFSYAVEPRSQALGAQTFTINGQFSGGPFTGEVNLQTDFGGAWNGTPSGQSFTGARWDHSAEFQNTYSKRWMYWDTLLNKFDIAH